MNSKILVRSTGALAIMAVLLLILQAKYAQAQIAECIGQPYGTEGCPLRPEDQEGAEPIVREHCGDARVDPDEECDLGRYNGSTHCTEDCELLYCGDGIHTPVIGEGCEPEREEVYVLNRDTGELLTEVQYNVPTCGTVCEAPICNSRFECVGGCNIRFLDPCLEEPEPVLEEEVPEETFIGILIFEEDEETGDRKYMLELSDGETLFVFSDVLDLEQFIDQQIEMAGIVQQDEETGESIVRIEAVDLSPVEVEEPVAEEELKKAASVCGNGIVEEGEQCDDGNKNNKDACPNDCSPAVCGDAVREGVEQCDDGNKIDGDGCSNTCTLAQCGNGVINTGEECDDGNKNDSDDCTNICRKAQCGDGILHRNEQCDDGNRINTDVCSNDCMLSTCGDSVLQENEECDDGDKNNFDECPSDCIMAVCGDGEKEGREECDNGSLNSNEIPDACRNDCRNSYCGDAVVDKGEECDGDENCLRNCTYSARLISRDMQMNAILFASVLASFGIMILVFKKIFSSSSKVKQGQSITGS